MKWTNPERLDNYGVRLVGWPNDVPAQNPSNLKQGQNKLLLQVLENGRMRFEKLSSLHAEGSRSQDYNVAGTVGEESAADVEEDFSWAYDADAEIGSTAPEESGAITLTQAGDKAQSRFSSTVSSSTSVGEDPKLDYLNDSHDMMHPPVKRLRTEDWSGP